MTDKQRITEILKAYTKKHNISASAVILEEYAEELLANGVIVPPCKVGDTVYRLAHNVDKTEWKVADFWEVIKIEIYEDEIGIIDDSDNYFSNEDIGKTVFLTKEEAEQALKEREQI